MASTPASEVSPPTNEMSDDGNHARKYSAGTESRNRPPKNKHRTLRCACGNGGPGCEKEESEREASFDVKPLEHFPHIGRGAVDGRKKPLAYHALSDSDWKSFVIVGLILDLARKPGGYIAGPMIVRSSETKRERNERQ